MPDVRPSGRRCLSLGPVLCDEFVPATVRACRSLMYVLVSADWQRGWYYSRTGVEEVFVIDVAWRIARRIMCGARLLADSVYSVFPVFEISCFKLTVTKLEAVVKVVT